MSLIVGIGTSRGLFLITSPQPGEPWKMVSQGLTGKAITCICPTSGGTLLAGASPGSVYRTRDFENWDTLYEGIKHPAIHALASDPTHPDRVYCGTAPASLFRSNDGGSHFEQLAALNQQPSASNWTFAAAPYRPRLLRLLVHPTKPSIVIAAVRTGGLYISADSGESWRDRTQGASRDITDFIIHPAQPSRIYATTSAGFFRSDDLGVTWAMHNAGLTHLLAGPMATAVDESDVIFIATHRSKDGGPYLMRSPNGGANWTICPGTLPYRPESQVTAMTSAKGHVFVGTNQGELFGTTNFGESWQILRSQFPPILAISVVYQS